MNKYFVILISLLFTSFPLDRTALNQPDFKSVFHFANHYLGIFLLENEIRLKINDMEINDMRWTHKNVAKKWLLKLMA